MDWIDSAAIWVSVGLQLAVCFLLWRNRLLARAVRRLSLDLAAHGETLREARAENKILVRILHSTRKAIVGEMDDRMA